MGPNADEVINVFGLAMRHEFTAQDLKSTMFAYPTGAPTSATCFNAPAGMDVTASRYARRITSTALARSYQ